jgi:RNA polymerase sigma-70 factor (ECF subfamily)
MSSSGKSSAGRPPDRFALLIERVRDGDEAAATELVAQYEGLIRRRARRLLGPALRVHLDSLDIAQSVNRSLLIGLRRAAFSVSTPDELTRLALTLVRRRVARHWRKRKREAECRGFADDLLRGTFPSLAAASEHPEVANAIATGEILHQIFEQLDGLDRQLVELRLEGYTTAEAARKLGVSAGLLRSRLSRLRKRLWEQGLSPDSI